MVVMAEAIRWRLAVLEGSGWASQDNAPVIVDSGRMVPGGTRNRHFSMQIEIPAAVKMLMVS